MNEPLGDQIAREPCEECGDTGVIVHEGTPWPIRRALGYTTTDSDYEPCPKGCVGTADTAPGGES